jgi:hypothetical protein
MRTFLAILGVFTGLILVGCPTASDDDDVAGECTNFSGHEFPDVTIDAPADGSNFTAGDVLNFVVTVTDADSDLTAMEMVAEDTIDNSADLIDVTVPAPDSDGRSAFTIAYDDLGQGAHTVRISAMDTDGCESNDSVVVCLDEPGICN